MKIKMLFPLFILFLVSADDPWDKVKEVIEKQPFFEDMALVVGKTERIFSYIKGNITLDKRMPVASSTKMVSSTMIMKFIENGTINLDTKVTDYIDFWAKDPSDIRSLITVKDCLTFTSGYGFGLTKMDLCEPKESFYDCVKREYGKYEHKYVPGTMWDYNEFHQQILGLVVQNLTGVAIGDMLENHLKKLNMTRSFYLDKEKPDLSGSLISTGNDYEKFMKAVWNGNLVNQTTYNNMFKDWTPYPGVNGTLESGWLRWFMGHYGFTNYYECPFYILRGYPDFPQNCIDANVHSDPGFFGWWPLYDLKLGYWFQIVVYGPPLLGSIYGFLVRWLVKPWVDRALQGLEQPPIERLEQDLEYFAKLGKELSKNEDALESLERLRPNMDLEKFKEFL